MAIIDFRSTSYLKAFILYASIAAIASTFAIEIRLSLEDKQSSLFKMVAPLTPENGINDIHKILVTILITFITSIIIYHLMYFIFGWGGGMIVSKNRIYGKYIN